TAVKKQKPYVTFIYQPAANNILAAGRCRKEVAFVRVPVEVIAPDGPRLLGAAYVYKYWLPDSRGHLATY
ncbi:MAG: hypothetical protein AAGG51_30030, partial [Cyanobacteria bacterium P01_G01_bin.54]